MDHLRMQRKRKGKRIESAIQVCQALGESPFINLIRLAHKMEESGNYPGASTNWYRIAEFTDAKRKPIDPAELKDLAARAVTLEELQRIKTAILAGDVVAIEESSVIDQVALPAPNAADDLL